MKLKYKKIVLVITMGTMFIGFVTFSLSTPKANSSTNVEQDDKSKSAPVNNSLKSTISPSPSPLSLVTPAAITNEKDFVLEWESHEDVKELIKKYYDASVKCDMEVLSGLVSDISHLEEDNLKKKYEFVDGYENIECYTTEGLLEGSYLVYVYSELKLKDIDTLAPGLTFLYVNKKEDGALQIYLGTLEDETQSYIEKAGKSGAVVTLIDSVNKKLEEAITKDPKLKDFYDKLETKKTE